MRSGLVYKLNPQLSEWYTWHSGESRVGKVQDVNPRSFGVELEHAPGQDWPEKQLSACLGVVAYLVWRFDMKFSGVMGHADVAWPRGRKMDPEGFPWAAFRADLAVRLEV
jgi:N-acetylmuramoyl-L-alanine amidase